MNKEKLLQWLRDNFTAHVIYGLSDRAESYKHVITEIENGKFDDTTK